MPGISGYGRSSGNYAQLLRARNSNNAQGRGSSVRNNAKVNGDKKSQTSDSTKDQLSLSGTRSSESDQSVKDARAALDQIKGRYASDVGKTKPSKEVVFEQSYGGSSRDIELERDLNLSEGTYELQVDFTGGRTSNDDDAEVEFKIESNGQKTKFEYEDNRVKYESKGRGGREKYERRENGIDDIREQFTADGRVELEFESEDVRVDKVRVVKLNAAEKDLGEVRGQAISDAKQELEKLGQTANERVSADDRGDIRSKLDAATKKLNELAETGDSLSDEQFTKELEAAFTSAVDEVGSKLGKVDDTSLTSTTVVEEKVVFSEDFNDGQASGQAVSLGNDTYDFKVEDGQLREKSNAGKGFYSFKVSDEAAASKNFEVSVDVDADGARNNDSLNNGAGVVFGYKDSGNYYKVSYDDYGSSYANKDGYGGSKGTHKDFTLVQVENGKEKVLDTIDKAELGGEFKLSVRVDEKDGISVSVNGEEKLSAKATGASLGQVGVYTYDNDNGVGYDNVEIKTRTEKVVQTGGGGVDNAKLEALSKQLDKLQQGVDRLNASGGRNGAAIGKLTEKFQNVASKLDSVADTASGNSKKLDDLGEKFKGVSESLGKAIAKTDANSKQITELQQTTRAVSDKLDGLGSKVSANGKKIDDLGSKFDSLKSDVKVTVDGLSDKIDNLEDKVDAGFDNLEDKIDSLGDQLGGDIDDVANDLKDAVNDLKDVIGDIDGQNDEALTKAVNKLKSDFNTQFDDLKKQNEKEQSALLSKLDEVTTELKVLSEQSAEQISLLKDQLGNLGSQLGTVIGKFDSLSQGGGLSLRSIGLFNAAAKVGGGALDKLIGVVGQGNNSSKMLKNLQFQLQSTTSRFGGNGSAGGFGAGGLNLLA